MRVNLRARGQDREGSSVISKSQRSWPRKLSGLVGRDRNARRSVVGAGGSGDCPTNGHSVLGRKIGTKRLIQRGLRSQSPWDRSPR
jgi:hypothetical protein